MRLKSFRNPEKKKWIRFEIVVAMLTSFLLHLPYYFQEEITPSICSESARDKLSNGIETKDRFRLDNLLTRMGLFLLGFLCVYHVISTGPYNLKLALNFEPLFSF